jgi:hypothetical protein
MLDRRHSRAMTAERVDALISPRIQISNSPLSLSFRGARSANPESRDSPMRNCPYEVRQECLRIRIRVLAARIVPELLAEPPPNQRAQGMPGARCTHGPLCNKKAQGQEPQVRRMRPGIPCAMALRLIRALPGDHRLVATVIGEDAGSIIANLDACFGAPGPHDFAVRETPFEEATRRVLVPVPPKLQRRRMSRARLAPPSRPPHPVPYVRDDRETSL